MGANQSSRRYTYQQYYDALKQQNGGNIQNINLNIDGNSLDPYEVLGVSKNASWDDLKRAYRKTAHKTHPDTGGSVELFQIVTEAFRKVGNDYQMRTSDRPHHELKATAKQYYSDRPTTTRNYDEYENQSGNFHDRFNSAFEKNKLDDDDDGRGYADIMIPSDPKRPEVSVEKRMNGYSSEKFNKMFEKEVPVRKDMVVYKEPEPLVMAKKLAFTELGVKTDDFSSTGEGGEKRSLQYTDYMKAHTTERLVDPRLVKQRAEYKNVEQYESARAKQLAKPLSLKEQERIERKKQQEEFAELERLRRLRERDQAIERHHEMVSRLAIKPN